MRVPVDLFTPILPYSSPPSLRMCGSVDSDSTLFTTVGFAYRPSIAGNGGLRRGMPRLPSSDSSRPVSSPQMYAPAPRCTTISRSKPEPRMFLPMKPLAPRVLDGLHEAVVAECELAAHVEERQVARDRVRGDHDPFDELMRVALDQHAVLERRRFAFVGVHDEVPRQHTFGEERPLEPGGEVRTAATAEPRLRDLLLDRRRVTLREHVAQRVVATRGERALHRPRVVGPLVQPLRDDPRFFERP